MNSIDTTIFRLINNLAGTLSFLNPVFIFFAKYSIFVLAIFMIYLWFGQRRMRKTLITAVIVFVVAEIIAKVLGIFIEHPQPFATLPNVFQLIDKEVGNSFPSDHTVLAFSICISLFLGSISNKRFLYIVLAFLIGIGRIWVGVHYPIDVLVGALIGTITALALYPFIVKSIPLKKLLRMYNKLEAKIFNTQPPTRRGE